LVTLAAVGILVSACSATGSGQKNPTGAGSNRATTGGGTTAPAPDLKAQLLTAADLPTGWSADTSADNGTGTPSCLKTVKTKTKAPVDAAASFIRGYGVPALDENMGYYRDRATASHIIAEAITALDKCKHLSLDDGQETVTGSIGAMSFPQVGDQSKAWSAVFTAEGLNLGFDIVIAQKGKELVLIGYGDLGTPSIDELKQLTDLALAKMPAN
jgi:hypothetical protein